MIRKYLPILVLAALTACSSNSRISSAPSADDSSGTASSTNSTGASSGGGDSSSYGSTSGDSSSYGGSSGAGSSYGGYGSSAGGGSSYSSQPSANCDAQPVQKMIGTKLTPDVAEQARTASTSSRTRVLKPGEVMTMEYDPTRLNLILDKQGALTALRCG